MIDRNSTKEEVLKAVQWNGNALRYASDELRGNRDVVLAAVKRNGRALKYASDELQADKELVLAARSAQNAWEEEFRWWRAKWAYVEGKGREAKND